MEKREDRLKTDRWIQIDKLIHNGRYPSVSYLAKEFGVSERTIKRDIEYLRDSKQAPLEYDRNKNGYYYTDSSYSIQNIFLSEGELFSISMILPFMDKYKNSPVASHFKNIISKISQILPDEIEIDPSFLNGEVIFIEEDFPIIDEQTFTQILKAVKTRKAIKFTYLSKGKETKRFFEPYSILNKRGNWYVIGNELTKNKIRNYSFSRMKNLVLTDESFSVPKEFDINRHIDPYFGIWYNNENEQEYEFLFKETARDYVLERIFHKNQQTIENEDGTVIVKFKSNQKQQIASWIKSFGSAVEVLKPAELREDVRTEAMKIIEMYEN